MPAEIVGTAFVRIRAITAGLASDIKDGVDKGVKDADVDKAGKTLGADLGDGAGKGLSDSLPGGIGDALDAPEIHKAAHDGGGKIGKDVSDGVADEHKKRNPFQSLLDALGRLSFKGKIRNAVDGGSDGQLIARDVQRGIDDQNRKRNPFRSLVDAFRRINFPSFGSIFGRGIRGEAGKTGEDAGNEFTKGAEKSLKKKNPFTKLGDMLDFNLPAPIKWAAIFGPTTLAPIIGTIVSLIGGLVEALGFLVTAAAGAGIALAGIAAVAIPGFAVLFAAFKTQSKQLDKFKEQVKKFAEPWKQVGLATQKTLLPGLTAALKVLTQSALVPLFVEFGGRIGQIVADFGHFAAATLVSEKNMRALGKILEASGGFFTNIRTAAIAFIDLLLPFLAAAAPLAVQFSKSLADWLTHLADIVNLKSGTGELAVTFQTWYDNFKLLVGIVGDVFSGLWGILQIASTSSTPFFDKIAAGAQAFSDWVKSTEGQNKIKAFFDEINPVLDELWRLFGNVIDLIVKPATGDGGATMFQRLASALDFLNRVLENPTTAKVVPYLLGLAGALSVLSFLSGPIKALGAGFDVIKGFLGFVGNVGLGVAKILYGIADSLVSLGVGVGKAAFSIIEALAKISIALITSPAGLVLLTIAAAATIVYLSFRNWDTIVEVLKKVWEWFMNLALPLKILVGIAAATVLILNPWLLFVGALVALGGAIKNWDKVVEVLTNVKDAIFGFITGLPAMIADALQAVVDFFKAIPGELASVGQAILDFFAAIPGKLKDALLAGLQALPGLILDAVGLWFDLGQNLLGLIADGLKAALPFLLEFFGKLPGQILRVITALLPKLLKVGTDILRFVLNGIVTFAPKLFTWFLQLPFEIGTLIRKGIVKLAAFGLEMIEALFKGITDSAPRVLKWFQDLPGNLLSMLLTAISFLYDLGGKIVVALFNGIVDNAGAVFDFFTSLPSTILGLLGDLASILVEAGGKLISGLLSGAKALFGSISEFFGGLPQTIVDLLVAAAGVLIDVGGKIPGWILQGITSLAQTLWDWFTGLPGAIIGLLTGLADQVLGIGGSIIGWIKDGLVAAATAFWQWFTDLPTTIWDTLNTIVSDIWDIGKNLIMAILTGVGQAEVDLFNWFLDLPGTIWDTLNGIVSEIWKIGTDLIGWIVAGLGTAGSTLWDWFKKLPGEIWNALVSITSEFAKIGTDILGWIISGLADLGKEILKKLQEALNWAVDNLNPVNIGKKIVGSVGSIGGSIISTLNPFDAVGGVFGKPTALTVAESGVEAVVPVTKPARAMAIMQSVGLDKMVLEAFLHGGTVSDGRTVAGETTMLHIENAVMTSPVDVDMIVSKVTSAYHRLAS
jgi:hypothetical protein